MGIEFYKFAHPLNGRFIFYLGFGLIRDFVLQSFFKPYNSLLPRIGDPAGFNVVNAGHR